MEWVDVAETFENVVSEMTTDPAGLVTIPAEVLARVTEGDDDPRFATFIIESGWSKSKRFWGPELFQDVASEMNAAAQSEPLVGYMGHIRPEDDPYTFPEIQLQWVGAKMLQNSGDKAKLAVKAYVLPGTKGKDYLKRGLVRTVSWRGKIAQEIFQTGVRVKKFAIESIDLSRPRAAGMSAKLVGELSSEMETEGGNSVKPEEIAALSANELRAHNPDLVKTLQDEATAPLTTQVSEMETTVEATAPVMATIPDLRKLLNLADNVADIDVLKAAVTEIRKAGKSLRDSVLESVLGKKLSGGDEATNKLVRKAIASEMATDLALSGDEDADTKLVGEMVDAIIDADDDLKKLVSEMQEAPPAPPVTERSRDGGQRELKPGYKSSSIRVRSARR